MQEKNGLNNKIYELENKLKDFESSLALMKTENEYLKNLDK